ncbi:MAG TPA: hypothetical protein ENI23_12765 [bacterium]|nr:hypothetical protein [bacterium]
MITILFDDNERTATLIEEQEYGEHEIRFPSKRIVLSSLQDEIEHQGLIDQLSEEEQSALTWFWYDMDRN